MRARLAELQALEADLMALRSRCDGSTRSATSSKPCTSGQMRKAMHPLRQGPRLASAMCDAGRDGNFANSQGRRRAMRMFSKCFVCFCFDSWKRLMDKRWRPKRLMSSTPA